MPEQVGKSSLPDLTEDIAKALKYWCKYVSELSHSEVDNNWGYYCMGKAFLKAWIDTQIEFGLDVFKKDTENAKYIS